MAERLNPYQPEHEKKGLRIKPIFDREKDLQEVAVQLGLQKNTEVSENVVETEVIQPDLSVEDALKVLFTPLQLRVLAQLLSEKDAYNAGGKKTDHLSRTRYFFGYGERGYWDPKEVTLVGAVQEKFSKLFGMDLKKAPQPELTQLFLETVEEVVSENPEKAEEFFVNIDKVHHSFIGADNGKPLIGMVGQFLSDLRAVFSQPLDGKRLSKQSLSNVISYAKTHPIFIPKTAKPDYANDYELHNLAGKMQEAAQRVVESEGSEKEAAKAELKDAVRQHVTKIITGFYNIG